MDLEREVAALHRVEEVEPDRELGSEPGERQLAEQLSRMGEDHVDGRQLDELAGDVEQQAVLLGNTVEAPRVVLFSLVQPTDLLHPLAAPDPRVEERDDPEG